MGTRKEVLQEHLERYLKASKEEKGHILDHVSAVLSQHRKSVVRSFKREQLWNRRLPKKRTGPRMLYTPDVKAALKDVWYAGNEVCAEFLHPLIGEYIAILQRDRMWKHGAEATVKLRQMSLGTLKRRIGEFFKIRRGKKGISSTKPSALKRIVPVFCGPWEDKPPGFGQVDTVVHCGSTLIGDMVYTVNYTDAAISTVVPHAQWNKGQEATQRSLQAIKDLICCCCSMFFLFLSIAVL